jgi:putative aldouronate transport system substrate-binding protein
MADHNRLTMTTRREFLRVAGASALLLSACAPTQPRPSGAASAVPTAAGPYPTYVPAANAPKPDYSNNDPRYDPGFENFPGTPFKAVQTPPGSGSTVNAFIAAYFPSPTPYDQNPTWQEVNKQLNATVKMHIVPGADFRAKLATIIASDDLPDIIHLYQGWSAGPNLIIQAQSAVGCTAEPHAP